MADPWPTIHEEREVLANDLSSLTDEQWATPSLCAELDRAGRARAHDGDGQR